MDKVSQYGYSDGSPYIGNPFLDIQGNNITMQNTGIPLRLQPMKKGKKKGKAIIGNPYAPEDIVFPDDIDSVRETPLGQLPVAQTGLLFNPLNTVSKIQKAASMLNPFNWKSPKDYSNKGDFNAAYGAARKEGLKKFSWNGNRYNSYYKGTPQQQLKDSSGRFWKYIPKMQLGGVQNPFQQGGSSYLQQGGMPKFQVAGQFKEYKEDPRRGDSQGMGINRENAKAHYAANEAERMGKILNSRTFVSTAPGKTDVGEQRTKDLLEKAHRNNPFLGIPSMPQNERFVEKHKDLAGKVMKAAEIAMVAAPVIGLGRAGVRQVLKALTKSVVNKRIPTITRGPINWYNEPKFRAQNAHLSDAEMGPAVNNYFNAPPVGKQMGQIPQGMQPYLRDREMETFKNWMRNQPPPQKMGIGLEDVKNFFTKPKYSKEFKIAEDNGVPHIEYKGQKVPIKHRFTLPDGSKRNIFNTFSAYGDNPSSARTIFGMTDDTGNYSTFYKSSGTNSGKIKGQVYPIEGFADKAFVGRHGQIDNWFIKGLKGEYKLPEGHPARGYLSKTEFDISKYLENKFPNSPYEIAKSNPKGFPTVNQDVPGAGNYAQKFFNNKLPYEVKDNPSIIGDHAIWQNNPIQNKDVFNPISERLPDWRKIVPIGGAAVGSAAYNVMKKKKKGGYINPYLQQGGMTVNQILAYLYEGDKEEPIQQAVSTDQATDQVTDQATNEAAEETVRYERNRAEDDLAMLIAMGNNPYSEESGDRDTENPYRNPYGTPSASTPYNTAERTPSLVTGNSHTSSNERNSNNPFREFNTPQEGRKALEHQLNLYKTGRTRNPVKPTSTLLEAMSVYAPRADRNDPLEYARFIAKKLNISVDTPIYKIDTKKWADAITIMEGNKKGNNPGNLRYPG